MSRNRGQDTKPELMLRHALWHEGFRYRVRSKLPGKPDLVFSSAKLVVFVDGCFWHGCPDHGVMPKTNSKFWRDKLGRNCERDQEVNLLLEADGWTVIRLWEHQIKRDLTTAVEQVREILVNKSS